MLEIVIVNVEISQRDKKALLGFKFKSKCQLKV